MVFRRHRAAHQQMMKNAQRLVSPPNHHFFTMFQGFPVDSLVRWWLRGAGDSPVATETGLHMCVRVRVWGQRLTSTIPGLRQRLLARGGSTSLVMQDRLTIRGWAKVRASEALTFFALFFHRCEKKDWLFLTNSVLWKDFLTSIASSIQEDVPTCLKAALSYATFIGFADQHFVGGLPTSILAVESLYRNWTEQAGTQLAFAGEHGLYDSDSAAHMRHLYQHYGIEVASGSILPADHLSLLLGFLALLQDNAPPLCVRTFIDEHLDWLDDLLVTIILRAPDADWLHAITRLLISYLKALRIHEDSKE